MKTLVYRIAKYSGLFAICRWLTRNELRILAYHGVWLGPEHFGNFLYMSEKKFAHRMQKIAKLRLPVLTLDSALRRRREGTLPRSPLVITIDDGWYSTYLHMLPALERHKLPATIYVTTYYSQKQLPVLDVALHYLISATSRSTLEVSAQKLSLITTADKREALSTLKSHIGSLPDEIARQGYFQAICNSLGFDHSLIMSGKWFHLVSEDMVKEMAGRGIDIQLHTHRHRIAVDGVSSIDQEIRDNRSILESCVNHPLRHFCYPSGVYDKSIWPELEHLGIESATTTQQGLVDSNEHIFSLPRILDGEEVSDIEFEAELAGFCEIKRRISRWISRAR